MARPVKVVKPAPEFAFNILYSEDVSDGATYLHTTEEAAKNELVSVFEDILNSIREDGKEEGWELLDQELDPDHWYGYVEFYDSNLDCNCRRILTVNRIYE